MGMYDCVNFEMRCPECNMLINDFQTKDTSGDRVLQLNSVDIREVFNFYTFCDNCKTWIEFNRKPQNITIDDFEMTIDTSKKVDKHG